VLCDGDGGGGELAYLPVCTCSRRGMSPSGGGSAERNAGDCTGDATGCGKNCAWPMVVAAQPISGADARDDFVQHEPDDFRLRDVRLWRHADGGRTRSVALLVAWKHPRP